MSESCVDGNHMAVPLPFVLFLRRRHGWSLHVGQHIRPSTRQRYARHGFGLRSFLRVARDSSRIRSAVCVVGRGVVPVKVSKPQLR